MLAIMNPDDKAGLEAEMCIRDSCKDCDLIVEAAFEDMNVKKTTFAELDKIAKPECILSLIHI